MIVLKGNYRKIKFTFSCRNGTVHYKKLHQDGSTKTCTILGEEVLRKYKGLKEKDANSLVVKMKDAIIPPPADGPPTSLKFEDSSKIYEIYANEEIVLKVHIYDGSI